MINLADLVDFRFKGSTEYINKCFENFITFEKRPEIPGRRTQKSEFSFQYAEQKQKISIRIAVAFKYLEQCFPRFRKVVHSNSFLCKTS